MTRVAVFIAILGSITCYAEPHEQDFLESWHPMDPFPRQHRPPFEILSVQILFEKCPTSQDESFGEVRFTYEML